MTHWIDVMAHIQTVNVDVPQDTQSHEYSENKSKSTWNNTSQLSEFHLFFFKIKYCQEYLYTSLQTCSWNFHVSSGAFHHAMPSLPGILVFPGTCKECGSDGWWQGLKSLLESGAVNWVKNKIQIKGKNEFQIWSEDPNKPRRQVLAYI